MIASVETFLRRLRRLGSRSEWLRRLLQLPLSEGPPNRTGLVLIQLEGLSRDVAELALQSGKLPFLQRLIERENYRVHGLYSGLPAITSAVQAELFYGVEAAVPGFRYRNPESGQIADLGKPEVAAAVEQRLGKASGDALLAGGSAYAPAFSGGSIEAYFCPSTRTAGPALRSAGPFAIAFLLVGHCFSLLRAAASLAAEFGLALGETARGETQIRDLWRNVKAIPGRVAEFTLARDLSVIGAKLDINRGLPIVFVNFRGYGERARRRGPGSRTALRALKRIDAASARLWRAANHAPDRLYDVWLYSDHGHIGAQTFAGVRGKDIERAVASAWQKLAAHDASDSRDTRQDDNPAGAGLQRPIDSEKPDSDMAGELAVAASGSAGFVYGTRPLRDEDREFIARELATGQGVPLVITRDRKGQLRAWAGDAEFRLPQQLDELLGSEHPFRDPLGQDLERLCRHADAGEIAFFGWREGTAPLGFDPNIGSRGGLTPRETGAFALLPEDVSLPSPRPALLRPSGLRRAALRHLGRLQAVSGRARDRRGPPSVDRLRVMTYNVHSCLGMDGKLSVERVARVIARYRPDVVALQELDVGRSRSGGVDQAELIARYLEMDFHFHPTLHIEEERYGDAVLTHLPMRLIRAAALPGLEGASDREPRGALWVALDVHGREIQLINTHLGLSARERLAQIQALLGSEWLAHASCRSPVILCGDLNATPVSAACRLLRTLLDDVQTRAPQHRPRNTFAGRLPTLRIDHILIDPELGVTGIEVPRSELVQVASDHLPLIADLQLPELKIPIKA